jgi:hypothetical protein
LSGLKQSADRLFEDATFRLLTKVFRFSGWQLGNLAPGTVAPDAVLQLPGSTSVAMLDCKASRDGFVMTAADERAIRDYAKLVRKQLRGSGSQLRYALIVSSRFPGPDDRRHPYHRRARSLETAARVKLTYVTADALAELALRVEEAGTLLSDRDILAWNTVFDAGRAPRDTVLALH